MDASRGAVDPRETRFDSMHAEAKAALGYSANSLRAVRERYREAYVEELSTWQALRDELETFERRPRPDRGADAPVPTPVEAAEAGAADARLRELRREVERVTSELGQHQQELSKLELAERTLESAWLFLERGDASLLADPNNPALPTDVQMRIVEAQEAERSRIAQEVHDGPAQGLSNAIFQVEYIERVLGQDLRLASTELRYLRELLRRDLGDVRAFISTLRSPALEHLGLNGAIEEAVENMRLLAEIPIETQLGAPAEKLSDAAQTVVLRVIQEALQNVRKHAAASQSWIVTRVQGDDWVLEVRDDGRGFDVAAIAARGRRNFGLQFMRERAELLGARFEVRSRPDGGTVVRLAIPIGGEESR